MTQRVAIEIDDIVDETFPAVEIYVVHRNPALRQKFLDVGADLERPFALYRENSLAADEKRLLGRVGEALAEIVPVGRRVMAMTDELNARLDDFEGHLVAMDAILDDEIQPLIHAETVAAADDAQISTDRAALWLVVLGLLGLGIAVAAAWTSTNAFAWTSSTSDIARLHWIC